MKGYRNKIFWIIGVMVLGIIFIACSKTKGGSSGDDNYHPPEDNDVSFPSIKIDRPSSNQVFRSGDSVLVEGKATDNSLYQGKIKIRDDASGILLDQKPYEIHGLLSYNFRFAYKTAVTAASTYTVFVEFEDHGLNKTIDSVKIKVNP